MGAVVIAFCIMSISMRYVNAVDCFTCERTAESCKDEVFQDYSQTSVECGTGSCIKTKYKPSGEVRRYCDSTRYTPGCVTTSEATICSCYYKDKCNGPVGDEAAVGVGLQCYDCYLNPECSDEEFGNNHQVLVNCGTGSCIKGRFKSSGAVFRFCSVTRLLEGCSDQSYDGHLATACACHDRDGCNQATSINQTLFNYIIMFVMIVGQRIEQLQELLFLILH